MTGFSFLWSLSLFLCRRSTVRQTPGYSEWFTPRQTESALVSGAPLSCATGPTALLRSCARGTSVLWGSCARGTISCGNLILMRASGWKMTIISWTLYYFYTWTLRSTGRAHTWTIITIFFCVKCINVSVWTLISAVLKHEVLRKNVFKKCLLCSNHWDVRSALCWLARGDWLAADWLSGDSGVLWFRCFRQKPLLAVSTNQTSVYLHSDKSHLQDCWTVTKPYYSEGNSQSKLTFHLRVLTFFL